MKRFICASLCVMLCAGLLAGCGVSLESDSSMVYVDSKGKVSALEVEGLDKDYYDAEELETYVNDVVDEYTSEHGKGTVKVEDLTVDGQTAKLRMKYKTTEDYTNFNGIELNAGKVVATLAAGYTYDASFVKVEDGKVTGSATKQEIYQEEGLKAVIIRANTDVKVDGEICYVSTENVKLTGADSVSIREGYSLEETSGEAVVETGTEEMMETELAEPFSDGAFETDVYTYIIYK